MAEKQPNLDSLFEQALELETQAELTEFLDQACGDDAELRQQLENLLKSNQQAGSFLEKPPAEFDATILGQAEGDLAASMEAGLAPAFGDESAVVIGDANHSVLRSLSNTLSEVPRVSLRESQAEGDDPIARPNSPEMPKSDSDSRYRLDGEIARGGMGAIIKGRDTDLGRDLAIKVLLDSHKDKPEVIQRFVEEAQIGGQLQHPGIAPIYELGQFKDKRPFFAMKLVKGLTLSKLLADREDAADERGKFIGIFEQVCQTMAYAHSRGVIHRDLKPANIMVGAFGEVQVMDWGLAKVLQAGGIADEKTSHAKHKDASIIQTMRSIAGSDTPGTFGTLGSQTQMGSVMGTPAYMPPEQALGEIDNMDERADVFGLGAILCEILTGKPPYVGDDGTQVYRMASRGKLDDAFSRLDACGADEDLIALTKHCLELDPKDRPRDAGVLAAQVTQYLESVETKLRETELAKVDAQARAEELGRRRKLLYAIAAMLLVGLVSAGFSASHFRSLEIKQRKLVQEKSNLALQNEKLANDREAERNAAVVARDAEAEQRRIAETAQRSEANLRVLAEEREQTIRETLYAAEMNLAAQAANGASGIRRVLELTSRWKVDTLPVSVSVDSAGSTTGSGLPLHRPDSPDAQRDLRSWEWYYLWSLSYQARLSLPIGAVCVDWSPDGRHFASVTRDGKILIWDPRSDAVHRMIEVSSQSLTRLAYSPDGTKLAVGGRDKLVHIYDPQTGALLMSCSVQYDELRSLCWSPDGQRLAMGLAKHGQVGGEISIWDTRSSESISSISESPSEGSIDWSPDGTSLIVKGQIFNATTLKAVPGPSAAWFSRESCQFNPQGNLFAMSTANSNEIQIRSTESSGIKVTLTGHRGDVRSLRWSPDGKSIASASDDETVRIWDVESGHELVRLRGHVSGVVDVQWSPDGKQLVSVDGTAIKVWDYEALSHNFPPEVRPGRIRTLVWDAEGKVLAADGGSGLHLFDSDSGQVLAQVARKQRGWQFGSTVAWNSTDSTIAVVDVDEVTLLDDHSLEQRLAWKLPPGSQHNTIVSSPDGTKIVVGFPGANFGIKVYDASTGDELLTALESTHQVAGVCWSPDGKKLACGSVNQGVVLDGTTGNVLCQLHLKNATGWMQSMAWSPSGNQIAVACAKQMILVFDAATGVNQQTLLGHTSAVECVAWSPDGTRLVSCSSDRTVRIWNPDNGDLLLTLNGHSDDVLSVAWNPDGMRIASASQDGDIRIWDASPGYRNTESPMVLETLNRRLAETPDRIEDLLLRRRIFEKLGNPAAMQRDRERVLEILQQQQAESPDDPTSLQQIAKLTVELEDWQTAIANYSRLISNETTNATLLARRARAYAGAQMWESAVADWQRVIKLAPSQLGPVFDYLCRVERWSEALAFGQNLIDEMPDDELRWLRLAPIAARVGDETYRDFCRRCARQFEDTTDAGVAERVIKSCLIKPGFSDFETLPGEVLAKALDEGTATDGLPPWAWDSLALLAYRSGDAESAVKYVATSEELNPEPDAHLLNLGVLALAEYELGHTEKSQLALDELSHLIARRRTTSQSINHDLLIAEILYREAEAKINGNAEPTIEDDSKEIDSTKE